MMQRIGRSAAVAAALALFVTGCSSETPPPTKPHPKPEALLEGPSGMRAIGDRVVVDGQKSTGVGTLTYRWNLRRPDDSQATLEFEDRDRNAFVVDVGGEFEVELVVVDAGVESDPAKLPIQVAYQAPTPVLELIAPNPTVALDHEVVADASGSHDPVGRPLQYAFRLTKRPAGSNASLSVDGARATFSPDRGGAYEVGVKVGNDTTWSDEIAQEIQVERPRNRAPVANAGSDRADRVGNEVVLDGRASSDPDEDELAFLWSFRSVPDGSVVTIEDADQPVARFVPDVPGDYQVQLEVSDGEFSDTATIRVGAVETVNNPPVIRTVRVDGRTPTIGEIILRPMGSQVMIELEVFDVDQDPVEVHWELTRPSGSTAELGEESPLRRSLAADVEGQYVVTAVASDGELDSDPITVSLRFRGDNKLPVAVLKTRDGIHSFPNGTEITLDGSDSYDTDEPEDPIVQYRFNVVHRPTGSTAVGFPREQVSPTLKFFLDRKTTDRSYRFSLEVRDALGGWSEATTLDVYSLNRAPVAKTPATLQGNLGRVHVDRYNADPRMSTEVVLNAILPQLMSMDPDGDALSFQWTLVDSPPGSNPILDQPTSSATGFYTDMGGDYLVELTVTDSDPTNPLSDTATVAITINE